MKWAFSLIALLAAASAQTNVLGVLETGDFATAVDTTTFFWGTLPEAKFIPFGWEGNAGTTDTFEFELLQPAFPAHVWIDYHRGSTIMPRETIIGLVQDSWYNLPRNVMAPTRVKFLRSPGVEEGRRLTAHGLPLTASPNPFRDRTAFRLSSADRPTSLTIFAASGRMVRCFGKSAICNLQSEMLVTWDGRDEAGRKVAAGVYVCRERASAAAPTLRLVRLD